MAIEDDNHEELNRQAELAIDKMLVGRSLQALENIIELCLTAMSIEDVQQALINHVVYLDEFK